MKVIFLIAGILVMIGAGIAFIVCLMLPSLTGNKINFKEVFVFLVLSVLVFFGGFIVTAASAIWMLVTRSKTAEPASAVTSAE